MSDLVKRLNPRFMLSDDDITQTLQDTLGPSVATSAVWREREITRNLARKVEAKVADEIERLQYSIQMALECIDGDANDPTGAAQYLRGALKEKREVLKRVGSKR